MVAGLGWLLSRQGYWPGPGAFQGLGLFWNLQRGNDDQHFGGHLSGIHFQSELSFHGGREAVVDAGAVRAGVFTGLHQAKGSETALQAIGQHELSDHPI